MLSLLQHPNAELPMADIVEPPHKGLHGISAKLRQKVRNHTDRFSDLCIITKIDFHETLEIL